MTEMCTPTGGLINPANFPIPTASPATLERQARDLRREGETVAGLGSDIKSAWAGLTSCYSAPEADTLYSVVDPVATDGQSVETSFGKAATALENFAEAVRDIKAKWTTLKSDSYAFLNSIDTSNDDWRKADNAWDRFWGNESPKVEEHQALLDRADALRREYELAEIECANAINADIPGRTRFVSGDGDGASSRGVYEHGYDGYLGDVDMAWGGSIETDHGWWVDAGSAVKDFTVGIAEDVGGITGMYSSEGWFQMSWGDAMWEYHEGNLQSLASLVGMYDSENESWGWAGWDSVGSAWKDAAHAVVPWEEWGDRPGYVIGTALLNIGATVGGALLTATGVGAVVGVPLMAWRGSAMLNRMGGGSSTPDVNLPDLSQINLPNLPRFGGGSLADLGIDLNRLTDGSYSPAQLDEMRTLLERMNEQNAADTNGSPAATDARRVTGGDSDDRPRVDPTAQNLSDADRFLEIVENPDNAAFDREVTQRHQDEIEETDRRAKTDPNGAQGSWEGNGIEADRPDGLEPEYARVPTGDGDTLTAEAEAPRGRTDQVVGDRGVLDSDLDSRFEDVVGDQFDSRDVRMEDRGSPVMNSDGGSGSGPLDGTGDSRGDGHVPSESSSGDGGTTGSGGEGGGRPGGPGSPLFDGDAGAGADGRSGDRGSAGGTGGGRPASPTNLEEFKNHTWGDKDNPANQQAFRDDVRRLINEDQDGREYNDFYKEYYKENNGHRKRADTVIGPDEWELPQISRADNGDWVPLEPAEQPRYLGEKTELRLDDPGFMPERRGDLTPEQRLEIERRERLREELGGLDNLAHDRRVAIDAARSAWDDFKEMERKYGEYKENGDNHPEVEEARKTYKAAQTYSTGISEDFGEDTARIAARFEFDGSVIRDNDGNPVMKHVVDENGKTVYEDGKPRLEELAPNLEGATEIKPSPFAPKNGNDQFDQIYRTEDGDIVIVEAKSSTKTELGERTVKPDGGEPRRVSQGTRAYLEDILKAMEERGRKPGNTEERALAREIRAKLKQGRVVYSVFKGNPVDNYKKHEDGSREWTGESTANGYDHRIFDLSEKAAS